MGTMEPNTTTTMKPPTWATMEPNTTTTTMDSNKTTTTMDTTPIETTSIDPNDTTTTTAEQNQTTTESTTPTTTADKCANNNQNCNNLMSGEWKMYNLTADNKCKNLVYKVNCPQECEEGCKLYSTSPDTSKWVNLIGNIAKTLKLLTDTMSNMIRFLQ